MEGWQSVRIGEGRRLCKASLSSSRFSPVPYLDFPPCLIHKLFPSIRLSGGEVELLWVLNNRFDGIVQIFQVLLNVTQNLQEFFLGLDKFFIFGRGDCLQNPSPALIECRCVAKGGENVSEGKKEEERTIQG